MFARLSLVALMLVAVFPACLAVDFCTERVNDTNSQVCLSGKCNLTCTSGDKSCDQVCVVNSCPSFSCSSEKCVQRCLTGNCSTIDCAGSKDCSQACQNDCKQLSCEAEKCVQNCENGGCNLSARGQRATQICEENKCEKLNCSSSESCDQNCLSGGCDLECSHSSTKLCTQTCNKGTCDMRCHSQKCDLDCKGGSCVELTCSSSSQNCTQNCGKDCKEMKVGILFQAHSSSKLILSIITPFAFSFFFIIHSFFVSPQSCNL